MRLTPSLPCHLKTTSKCGKSETLKPFVFIFALACERIFIKTDNVEKKCYRIEKYTLCRCVCASFSPDILQARAEKGLIPKQTKTYRNDLIY